MDKWWERYPRVEVPEPAPYRRRFDGIDLLNVLGALSGFALLMLWSWASFQPQVVDNCHAVCETSYMEPIIVDTETTGPVTRVYVAGHEDEIQQAAQEHLGTEALGDVIYHSEGAVYEVVFENSEL